MLRTLLDQLDIVGGVEPLLNPDELWHQLSTSILMTEISESRGGFFLNRKNKKRLTHNSQPPLFDDTMSSTLSSQFTSQQNQKVKLAGRNPFLTKTLKIPTYPKPSTTPSTSQQQIQGKDTTPEKRQKSKEEDVTTLQHKPQDNKVTQPLQREVEPQSQLQSNQDKFFEKLALQLQSSQVHALITNNFNLLSKSRQLKEVGEPKTAKKFPTKPTLSNNFPQRI